MHEPSLRFEAIGTQWVIETDNPMRAATKDAMMNMIEDFDKTYSRFRADSLVSKIAQQAGTYVFPDDARDLFGLYEQFYTLTEGKMTPLIGHLLEELGYDAQYSLQPQSTIHQVPVLGSVISRQGSVITTTEPLVIDIGAIGKGYLIDKIAALLDADSQPYMIDGSGDMRVCGNRYERIGLEDPRNPSRIIGVIELTNTSLCGSAVQRRAWGDGLHHIVDPDTLSPTTGTLATWVTAKTAAIADGLATALFFTEPEQLVDDFDFTYVRLLEDGTVEYSENFTGELFT